MTWWQILIAAWTVCVLLCFWKACTLLRSPVNSGDNDSPPAP